VSVGGNGNPTNERSHLKSKLLNFCYCLSDIKNRLRQLLGNSAAEVLGNCLVLCFTLAIIFATVTIIVVVIVIIIINIITVILLIIVLVIVIITAVMAMVHLAPVQMIEQ
jgi:hypothetical protein